MFFTPTPSRYILQAQKALTCCDGLLMRMLMGDLPVKGDKNFTGSADLRQSIKTKIMVFLLSHIR